ncbi:response regulator aspartate phosphatase [Bacillus chungangensis]|uniref:Tetratricopeptide (TPR) repeat protein n=1 Tax=Bacillus chungangensis TaxID=587633 RepID=A0ABT9WWP6_9BACI|nr:tetratricopeptide repeat protein [Bacillus chungangensis]MDQ0177165.1 tetratricopeptide (TPR) repeat protein [Bacillus chungangensis]
MTVDVVTKDEITKLLNNWYSKIRSHHVDKAKELKTEIDQKMHRMKEDQDILLHYSLLDFRFQILTGDFQHDLILSEKLSISEQTETFLQYYYHFFKFIYYTEISQYRKAKEHYESAERLLEAIPDEAEKAEFNYRASIFYYHIGDYSHSISHAMEAKRFFSCNPSYEIKSVNCKITIAISCIELSMFDLAEKQLKSSLNILTEQKEKLFIVYYNLGLLYSQKGHSELAIKYLSASIKEKKHYKTMFLLAREYFKVGNIEDAHVYIQNGLKVCDKEYMHHFQILKEIVDQSSVEQIENVVEKALHYFKKENMWRYVQDYAGELAVRFFAANNPKKSTKFFRLSYDAKQILNWEILHINHIEA